MLRRASSQDDSDLSAQNAVGTDARESRACLLHASLWRNTVSASFELRGKNAECSIHRSGTASSAQLSCRTGCGGRSSGVMGAAARLGLSVLSWRPHKKDNDGQCSIERPAP